MSGPCDAIPVVNHTDALLSNSAIEIWSLDMDAQLLEDGIEVESYQTEIFEVGAHIPLGVVPRKMHAWTIRREHHGEPSTAFVLKR